MTLATIIKRPEVLTRQQAYDRMREYFARPDAQQAADDGNCAYRAEDGSKCAIGCLIPDDLYDPEMEGASTAHLFDRFHWLPFAPDDVEFYRRAQRIHDTWTPYYDQKENIPFQEWMLSGLDALAAEWGLKVRR